jgi:hypothetical protein
LSLNSQVNPNTIIITAPPRPGVPLPFDLTFHPGQSSPPPFYTYNYSPLGLQDTALDAQIVNVPSTPTLKLQTPVTSGAQISTQLVDASTGLYNASEVTSVANAMGFSSFDFLQLMTEELNGQPFTTAACTGLYPSVLSPYPCTYPIARSGQSFDTKNGLIDLASASTVPQVNLLYDAGLGAGRFADTPCQPGSVQLNFSDLLVGVTSSGVVQLVNSSPNIQGNTGFSWTYTGDDQIFQTGCPGGVSTVVEADPTAGLGIGTATFTGLLDLKDLSPDVDRALITTGLLPAPVPEPSSLAILGIGALAGC